MHSGARMDPRFHESRTNMPAEVPIAEIFHSFFGWIVFFQRARVSSVWLILKMVAWTRVSKVQVQSNVQVFCMRRLAALLLCGLQTTIRIEWLTYYALLLCANQRFLIRMREWWPVTFASAIHLITAHRCSYGNDGININDAPIKRTKKSANSIVSHHRDRTNPQKYKWRVEIACFNVFVGVMHFWFALSCTASSN